MGMTDKQFNGYVRILLNDVEEAKAETDVQKKDEKLDKIIAYLRQTLED